MIVSVQWSNTRSLAILQERTDYVDDSKSIVAVIKGGDIDITSDNDKDEDKLEILDTFALAFVKDEKSRVSGKK